MSDSIKIDRPYFDQHGNPQSLSEMMKNEPDWVMSRFQFMKDRIEKLEWDYDAACATVETRDAEIEKLEATLTYLAEEAANPNDRVIAKRALQEADK